MYTLQAGKHHAVVPEIAHCLETTCHDYSRADGFNMVVHGTQDPDISDIAHPLGTNNGGENAVAINENQRAEVRETAVRRLTPLECERLQGFPDGYTDIPGGSDSARYRALGNSMAVPVMKWLGERIGAVHD